MQHYTTIEQSKKLVELGLNLDTADMSYTWNFDDSRYEIMTTAVKNWIVPKYAESTKIQQVLPCWSLGELINLMPSMIYKGGETFTLMVHKDVIYHVCYKSHYHLDEIWFSKENLLDAAYDMLVWLIENGYITTEKNQYETETL